ncbi:23S rRNA (adenine(2030)-N(6))-methyltransferase RlmJ [Microbulbifer hydrolyticus]|uniref:Ribosomal RNA large subunit methyltransferase J n=1 Tax=Microbulbifer hydrolyticus TaxID=48074 RepID=A0A6P1T6T8_9GAMM|nr:23S rRNA (adenine(2030)-N(6))-methyltransferase RlmJ [Microbulbifer hydrolyticus]MBB5211519.1 23S rRNA (adenine2030-N6)-methyltransferase [Microbulbifer hydrolyticus]QHQ37737.1 23S rRNA (adenine(2030)-N(6))-methyltransferase RlmJ [Microbulbifer hydrolyticus]
MLSYRHGFHAGNFADVLKHCVQVEIISYLQKKEAPFDYIDTHAGAGRYALTSDMAQKNREYMTGIGRLFKTCDLPGLQNYLRLIEALNPQQSLQHYPGSPLIATSMLRPQDKAWLFELHPSDAEKLRHCVPRGRQCQVREEDGFAGLASLLPSRARRALILIDPPYEQKADYQRVVDALRLIHRKMATATVALWYPVVERRRIEALEKQLVASGIRNIELYELGVRADACGGGMTSSGMIVINPPWTLRAQVQALLPPLAAELGVNGGGHYRCEVLVAE